MKNYQMLLLLLVLSGCATVGDPQTLADNRQIGAMHASALNCRMGAAPVCKVSRGPGGESMTSCECAYVPDYLPNGRTFTIPRRRR